MLKNMLNRYLWSLSFIATGMLILLQCSSDPLLEEYGVWSFSGYVVDGATQARLPGVTVGYMDREGVRQKVITDQSGKFFISKLPYGDRTFEFSCEPADSSKTSYTAKMIVTGSYSESRSIDGLLGEVSKVVTLYPLSGAISGELYVTINGSKKAVPAESLDVKVHYLDSTMINATPSAAVALTDKNGVFLLEHLPLAPGAVVTINNYTFRGITYTIEPVTLTSLFESKQLALGRLYLTAQDTTNLLISSVQSNVLSADGFGLSDIPVDAVIWYLLPHPFSQATASLSTTGGEKVVCKVKRAGDTVYIFPEDNLPADTLFTAIITSVDSSGVFTAYTLDGKRMFRTAGKVADRTASNVLTSDGYGKTGVPADATLWYVLPEKPAITGLEVTIDGEYCGDCAMSLTGDTLNIDPVKPFNYDTLVTIAISGVDSQGNRLHYTFGDSLRFRTERRSGEQVTSNVLSKYGFGIDNVSVTTSLWYALPVVPLPATVAVSILGGGSPATKVTIKEDTVFVNPENSFTYDAPVAVIIKGADTTGTHFEYTLDDVKQFRTEKNVVAIASNTWRKPGDAQQFFRLNDTLWVQYSEKLDTDANKIDWLKSAALFGIYGKGSSANADAWVREDTLFVRPDQRLAVISGGTMGFKVSVLSATGKRSDSLDVVATIESDNYFVKWTNTKDNQGNMRQDFGTRDSIVVVSNSPVKQVRGISGVAGKAVPPDLSLDNVVVRGDTIVYKPSLFLKPDSLYGLDFDVVFADGNLRYDVLGVSWKTSLWLQIESYNNRDAGGFRPLKVIGDSLTVKFSAAVDTGANAVIPFRVNMVDVRYRTVKTRVVWNAALTVATIFNIDTLPAADFDASPAYSGDAINTRAVKSVTFDLVTKDGEQVMGFKPKNEDIEIHTEKGFCVVDANILLNHDNRNRVERGESTVNNFAANGAVHITFSRAIDTIQMKADNEGLAKYAGIKDGASAVSAAITFSADGKTLIITSDTNLSTTANYTVWLKNIPAQGIANAPAISKDAGTFSGKSTNYNLLDKAFMVR